MRSCGRAISRYSAVRIEMLEAQDAWCPPTFSPSRLGRMWLALWIIHEDSQSNFRSSCFNTRTRPSPAALRGSTKVSGAFMNTPWGALPASSNTRSVFHPDGRTKRFAMRPRRTWCVAVDATLSRGLPLCPDPIPRRIQVNEDEHFVARMA
jgi:hypothetical protein